MPNPNWKKGDFRWLIHTPAELGRSFVEFAEKRRDVRGVQFGIPSVDKRVIPMAGGDYIGVIARPGHGKSALLAALALREARRIEREGTAEMAVVVTWEQMAEEFEMMIASGNDTGVSSSDIAWGRADVDALKGWAVKRAGLPLWTVGYGAFRTGNAPRMVLSTILDAIENIEVEFGKKPTLVTLDYLQLIPSELGTGDRVAQVTEASNRIKELALRIDCPIVAGVQARREVDDRVDKIPTMRDGQWSSNIEQDADKLFSIMRPARYQDPSAEPGTQWMEYQGKAVQVVPSLCFFRMLKQRFEDGQHTWVLSFAPQYLRLAEMELETPAGGSVPSDGRIPF